MDSRQPVRFSPKLNTLSDSITMARVREILSLYDDNTIYTDCVKNTDFANYFIGISSKITIFNKFDFKANNVLIAGRFFISTILDLYTDKAGLKKIIEYFKPNIYMSNNKVSFTISGYIINIKMIKEPITELINKFNCSAMEIYYDGEFHFTARFKYFVERGIVIIKNNIPDIMYFELKDNLIAANTYFNDSLICISKTNGNYEKLYKLFNFEYSYKNLDEIEMSNLNKLVNGDHDFVGLLTYTEFIDQFDSGIIKYEPIYPDLHIKKLRYSTTFMDDSLKIYLDDIIKIKLFSTHLHKFSNIYVDYKVDKNEELFMQRHNKMVDEIFEQYPTIINKFIFE